MAMRIVVRGAISLVLMGRSILSAIEPVQSIDINFYYQLPRQCLFGVIVYPSLLWLQNWKTILNKHLILATVCM